MKIGILQCGHAHDDIAAQHGDYTDMFQRLLAGNEFEFQTYSVVDMEFPDSIDAAEGWLLSGSRHGVYEDHGFIEPLETFIRDAYAAPVPMVGICFGHQIIAQALGGVVKKFNDGWAIGKQDYEFDALGPITLNAWHQDQVLKRPKDARKIASNAFCENAALIYGDRVYTLQPHPEFNSDVIEKIVEIRRGTPDLTAAQIDAALSELDAPISSPRIASEIAVFFKRPRKAHHV